MINFKVPKLITIYKVSKGKMWYVCSCGRLASARITDYNKKIRCKHCTALNELLLHRLDFSEISDLERKELFDKFYQNGLLDYAEDVQNGLN